MLVYNDVSGYDNHAFHYVGDQTLLRFRRGMCNVVVYASRTAHKTSQHVYNYLKNRVEGFRGMGAFGGLGYEIDGAIQWRFRRDMKDYPRRLMATANEDGEKCRFVGLIRKRYDPEVRSR